jgi:hypothetical protein
MSRTRITATAMCFAALGGTATATAAHASRGPTPDERTQVLASINPAIEYCYAVELSTVDPDWAVYFTASPRPIGCDRVGDGYAISHRDPTGTWTVVHEDSGGDAPCSALGLSPAIGTDLKVCVAPVPVDMTAMYCWGQRQAVLRRRPRTCKTGPGASAPLRLSRLRWKNWGRSRATATARLFDSGTSLHAKVTAYGVTEFAGVRQYTRLRVVTSRYTAKVILTDDPS